MFVSMRRNDALLGATLTFYDNRHYVPDPDPIYFMADVQSINSRSTFLRGTFVPIAAIKTAPGHSGPSGGGIHNMRMGHGVITPDRTSGDADNNQPMGRN